MAEKLTGEAAKGAVAAPPLFVDRLPDQGRHQVFYQGAFPWQKISVYIKIKRSEKLDGDASK